MNRIGFRIGMVERSLSRGMLFTTFISCMLFNGNVFSQNTAPQGFNYQAVARDLDGSLIVNRKIVVQITFRHLKPNGSIIWQEAQEVQTNDFGLFSMIIGEGATTDIGTVSSFSAIDWSIRPYYIEIDVDFGNGLINMGVTKLMSVPFATIADSALKVPKSELEKLFESDTNFANYLINSFSNNSDTNNFSDSFDGNRAITREGLPKVTPGGSTVIEFLENLFYPPEKPTCSIKDSKGLTIIEYCSPSAVINKNLEWSVVRKTNPITSIIVDSTSVPPTGWTQSGTYSVNLSVNQSNTFIIEVSDSASIATASITYEFKHQRYWGSINKNSSITDADILSLNGAGVGSGREFASSANKYYNGIDAGTGSYLIFAFPSSWSSPVFVVNGLINNAFTKVRDNAFTNQNGGVIDYQVWISNTKYFGPTLQLQIQ